MDEEFSFKIRALAFLCRVCPVCVVARRVPGSAFAKKLASMEKGCPACRAHHEVEQARHGG
jgi:hypothetical protein